MESPQTSKRAPNELQLGSELAPSSTTSANLRPLASLVSASSCTHHRSQLGSGSLFGLMAPSPAAPTSGSKLKSKGATTQPNHSSLSSIVSHLVRSQLGATASEVKDDELDRHVAEMLLKEAKEKEKAWGSRTGGGGSYLQAGGEDK